MSIWLFVLIFFSLGLLLINVFRFNVFFALASISVNIAIAKFPGAPLYVIWAAYLLAGGEAFAFAYKLIFGNTRASRKKRYTG